MAAAAAVATPGNVDWPSVLTSASSDLRQQSNGVEYAAVPLSLSGQAYRLLSSKHVDSL